MLVKVTPGERESRLSLITRLVYANGYAGVGTVLKSIHPLTDRVRYANLNYRNESVAWEGLLKELVNEVSDNDTDFVLNQFDDVLFGRDPPTDWEKKQAYFYTSTRYCPDCIRESHYHRLHWDVAWVTTCVQHGTYLIEKCPCCRRDVWLTRLMERYCSCGFKFETADGQPANSVVLQAQKLIQELLWDRTQHVVRHDGNIPARLYFDNLDIYARILHGAAPNHMVFTGIDEIPEKVIYMRPNGGIRKDIGLMTALSVAGHRLITDPGNFLPSVIGTVESMHKRGRAVKAPLFARLLENRRNQFEKSIYHHFYSQSSSVYVGKKRISIKVDYFTMLETTHLLGTSYADVKKLIDRGILFATREDTVKGTVIQVNRDSVRRWKKRMDESLNKFETGKVLHVYGHFVVEMFHAGLIEAFRGRPVDGYYQWRFERENIEKFLKQTSRFTRRVDVIPESYEPIKHVVKRLALQGIGLIQVLHWLARGQLSSVHLSPIQSLDDIFISREVNLLVKP